MDGTDDIQKIIIGAFSLLGLLGVPVAALAAPVAAIVSGVIGLDKKGKRK